MQSAAATLALAFALVVLLIAVLDRVLRQPGFGFLGAGEVLTGQHEQGLLGDTVKRREADELRRLQKENRLLRQERDILKKAAAYFAKESL